MSKYDINQVREALMKTVQGDTWNFCRFDGNRDLIKNVSGVQAMEALIPNSPVIFKLYIDPVTTFGPWDSYLDCEFDATNELIRVIPDFDSQHDDAWQRAIAFCTDFNPDLEEQPYDMMDFFNHIHFSTSDLVLIFEAVRRYSIGLP